MILGFYENMKIGVVGKDIAGEIEEILMHVATLKQLDEKCYILSFLCK